MYPKPKSDEPFRFRSGQNQRKVNKCLFNIFSCFLRKKASKQRVKNSSENLTKEAPRIIRNSDGNALIAYIERRAILRH